jgi:IS1 family transposase
MEECILPDNYLSCHIRRGDKNTETDYIPLEKYIENIAERDVVFVLTDDYTVYETLQQENPKRKWHTICNKSDRGYNQCQLDRSNVKQKTQAMIKLFASIEIMNKSELFIGTKTSNPSVFMSIYNPNITKGVDSDINLFVDFLMQYK